MLMLRISCVVKTPRIILQVTIVQFYSYQRHPLNEGYSYQRPIFKLSDQIVVNIEGLWIKDLYRDDQTIFLFRSSV